MKIDLALSSSDDKWMGLCQVDEEIFKVVLIPSRNPTQPWQAVLLSAAWVPLDEGGVFFEAIRRARGEYELVTVMREVGL